MRYYILEGKIPVKVEDMMTWYERFTAEIRTVNVTVIGDVTVSTVFLGMDHNYGGGKPILFETVVFGGELDRNRVRYFTWEEAEEGHHRACAEVLNT